MLFLIASTSTDLTSTGERTPPPPPLQPKSVTHNWLSPLLLAHHFKQWCHAYNRNLISRRLKLYSLNGTIRYGTVRYALRYIGPT